MCCVFAAAVQTNDMVFFCVWGDCDGLRCRDEKKWYRFQTIVATVVCKQKMSCIVNENFILITTQKYSAYKFWNNGKRSIIVFTSKKLRSPIKNLVTVGNFANYFFRFVSPCASN